MKVRVRFRSLLPADVADLDWSGGPVHIREVARAWQESLAGDVLLLVGSLDNGRLVALGGVDFRLDRDAGRLWMLAVEERLQSLGIGQRLIAALEAEVLRRSRLLARLAVELDNPRAAALYRRLGYADQGPVTISWPDENGGTYDAACRLLERDLRAAAD